MQSIIIWINLYSFLYRSFYHFKYIRMILGADIHLTATKILYTNKRCIKETPKWMPVSSVTFNSTNHFTGRCSRHTPISRWCSTSICEMWLLPSIFSGMWCMWALNDFQANFTEFQNQMHSAIQLSRLLMLAVVWFNNYICVRMCVQSSI